MNEELTHKAMCSGKACSYNLTESVANCSSGSGHCFEAKMVRIHENGYHDEELVKATDAINAILAKIPADSKKRELSILATPFGALLAWVEHGTEVPEGSLGPDADPADLAAMIGLKSP